MIEFGPLDALARDPTVTDVAITCDGKGVGGPRRRNDGVPVAYAVAHAANSA